MKKQILVLFMLVGCSSSGYIPPPVTPYVNRDLMIANMQHQIDEKPASTIEARSVEPSPFVTSYAERMADAQAIQNEHEAFLERQARREAYHQSPDGIAERICHFKAHKEQAEKAMREEMRNPSDIVDMRMLHDLGDDVREDEKILSELQADYIKASGKRFDEAKCD